MKRSELLRYLRGQGCELLRETAAALALPTFAPERGGLPSPHHRLRRWFPPLPLCGRGTSVGGLWPPVPG